MGVARVANLVAIRLRGGSLCGDGCNDRISAGRRIRRTSSLRRKIACADEAHLHKAYGMWKASASACRSIGKTGSPLLHQAPHGVGGHDEHHGFANFDQPALRDCGQ